MQRKTGLSTWKNDFVFYFIILKNNPFLKCIIDLCILHHNHFVPQIIIIVKKGFSFEGILKSAAYVYSLMVLLPLTQSSHIFSCKLIDWLVRLIHMVRNGKLWYEMVMVQNSYGTKWFLVMVRNCNFVVRNGKLWYEMTCFGLKMTSLQGFGTITISYHNLPFRTICILHHNHFVP
jgi:hypothetical protein